MRYPPCILALKDKKTYCQHLPTNEHIGQKNHTRKILAVAIKNNHPISVRINCSMKNMLSDSYQDDTYVTVTEKTRPVDILKVKNRFQRAILKTVKDAPIIQFTGCVCK